MIILCIKNATSCIPKGNLISKFCITNDDDDDEYDDGGGDDDDDGGGDNGDDDYDYDYDNGTNLSDVVNDWYI